MVPNVIAYNALVSAFEKGSQLGQALEMFEAMLQQGVVPNVIAYNAFGQCLREEYAEMKQ